MDSESRVYVAGNTGLVGSAIVRTLHWKGYTNILSSPSHHWDLRNQLDVERFFRVNEPEYVYLAAAKVGGIGANAYYPGHFIYDNLMIQTNVIHAARKFGVKKLLFLASSCIYPKFATQPIKEESWKPMVGKLLNSSFSDLLLIKFKGSNSNIFQAASRISQTVKQSLYLSILKSYQFLIFQNKFIN